MKKLQYIISSLLLGCAVSCTSLDQPSLNIVQDKDIFASEKSVSFYMSSLYSLMPIEDFKYGTDMEDGFFRAGILRNLSNNTGEGLNAKHANGGGGIANPARGYWTNAYKIIRQTNYFIETVPSYAANFNNDQKKITQWIAECRFIRAYTYFALVKRYGGVPILDRVQSFPGQPLEELQVPRNTEEEVFDKISEDLDFAIANLGETSSMRGRANRYVAAGFKSRAMLTAGSIARYNQIKVYDKASGKQLTGIPADRAEDYFEQSWKAAKLLEGKYDLYKAEWKADDKTAQADNFAALFLSVNNNPECVFAREYKYPESGHSWDALFVPYTMHGPDGFSTYANPTLDFVELFEGFPKNDDNTIKVLDDQGKYQLYDNEGSIFADCEPRLRGTVLLPGQVFKGMKVDLRRGIYTGSVPAGGIAPLMAPGTKNNVFPSENFIQSTNNAATEQIQYTLSNGHTINASGLDGPTLGGSGSVTGFHLRKMLDPKRTPAESAQWISDQPWMDIRYAEVLLNRAEAALELHQMGISGDVDYRSDAFTCINLIRERAGATLLSSADELSSASVDLKKCYIVAPNRGLQIIRVERRKELAFENKIWWDMIRWRTADIELNNRVWRKFNPILVAQTASKESDGKYFFEGRDEDSNTQFNFPSKMYYEPIPNGEITRNPNLTQNEGY